MTSEQIKKRLINFYKIERGADIVATEVCCMDLVAVFQHHIIEVEIKVSKADFIKDFEKQKHYFYYVYKECIDDKLLPNKFYYAVPEELKDFACEYIKSHDYERQNYNYGVISFNGSDQPYVFRRAKELTKLYSKKLEREVTKRVMTEYMRMTETYFDVTKNQKRHRNIFNLFQQMLVHVPNCYRCPLKASYGTCLLLRKDIKEENEKKKGCLYLFNELNLPEESESSL